MNCPNNRIKNPVMVRVVSGKYVGKTGWADKEANEIGVRAFCAIEGHSPFQWNAPSEALEDIES